MRYRLNVYAAGDELLAQVHGYDTAEDAATDARAILDGDHSYDAEPASIDVLTWTGGRVETLPDEHGRD